MHLTRSGRNNFDGFSSSKATHVPRYTSMLSLHQAQDRVIHPTLITPTRDAPTTAQTHIKRRRSASERPVEMREQTDTRFVSRLRRNRFAATDVSKLDTLGEEQVEERETPPGEKADEATDIHTNGYVNEAMSNDEDESAQL